MSLQKYMVCDERHKIKHSTKHIIHNFTSQRFISQYKDPIINNTTLHNMHLDVDLTCIAVNMTFIFDTGLIFDKQHHPLIDAGQYLRDLGGALYKNFAFRREK